jgi:hypothetical protein
MCAQTQIQYLEKSFAVNFLATQAAENDELLFVQENIVKLGQYKRDGHAFFVAGQFGLQVPT